MPADNRVQAHAKADDVPATCLHIIPIEQLSLRQDRRSSGGKISGLKETDGKDRLVTALKASFDFCSTGPGKVDDSKLGDTLELFGGREGTRAFALIALTNDWADHYSTVAMYLA